MTHRPSDTPESNSQSTDEPVNSKELLQLLRRKESNWVAWGEAIEQLQKAGYNSQVIFEETGFEPIQQNQVVVAAQVYTTLIQAGVSDAVRSRFERTGSDIVYELRILAQPERTNAAEFIVARELDVDGAREVARALQEFSRRSTPPEGFSEHPGDAVAYQYWRIAKQQNNLQQRSRLIAQGLTFAHSTTARQKIEQLLIEAVSGTQRQAPRLPVYRIEADEQLPHLLPIAGQLPLAATAFTEVPALKTSKDFQIIEVSASQKIVAVPSWQVVRTAQDPVAILANTNQLPTPISDKTETVLLLVDRTERQWSSDNYYAIERGGQLEIQWFAEQPDTPLLGQLILVLRPKKFLDEPLSRDLWQIDE